MLDARGTCSVGMIRSVIGGFLVNVPMGYHLTIGNLAIYVISYYRHHNGDEALTNEDIVQVLQYGITFGFLGGILGAVLEQFVHARAATFAGCCVYIVGCSMSYFTIQKPFPLFVLTYGVINSAGFFMVYAVSIQNAVQWAPRYSGTVSALVSGSCGIGSWIFDLVISKYVNPQNLVPDHEAADGNKYFTDVALLKRTQSSFLMLSAIYAACMLIGVILMVNADLPSPTQTEIENGYMEADGCKGRETQPFSFDAEDEYIELADEHLTKHDNYYESTEHMNETPRSELVQRLRKSSPSTGSAPTDENSGILAATISILKSRAIYVIWLYVCLIEVVAQFGINLYKVYGQTFIADDMFLAVIGSLAGLSNFISRPCWGVLMDVTNLEVAMKLLETIFTILCGLHSLMPHAGRMMYLVWICITYACNSGVWPLVSSAAAKLYGNKNVAVTITLMQTAMVCGVFAGSQMVVVIQGALGWDWLFVVLTLFCTIAFSITFLLPR